MRRDASGYTVSTAITSRRSPLPPRGWAELARARFVASAPSGTICPSPLLNKNPSNERLCLFPVREGVVLERKSQDGRRRSRGERKRFARGEGSIRQLEVEAQGNEFRRLRNQAASTVARIAREIPAVGKGQRHPTHNTETQNATASAADPARRPPLRPDNHSLCRTGGEVSPGGPGEADSVGPEEPAHKAEGVACRAPKSLGRRFQASRGRQHSGPGAAAGGRGGRAGQGRGVDGFPARTGGRRGSAKAGRRVVVCFDRGGVGRVRLCGVRRRQVHAERATDELMSEGCKVFSVRAAKARYPRFCRSCCASRRWLLCSNVVWCQDPLVS